MWRVSILSLVKRAWGQLPQPAGISWKTLLYQVLLGKSELETGVSVRWKESVPDARKLSSGERCEGKLREQVSYSYARKINVLLILK